MARGKEIREIELIFPAHQLIENWAKVLWQEYRACGDRAYAKHLGQLLWAETLWTWVYSLGFRRQARPYAAEVEAALRSASAAHEGIRYLWEKRLDSLDEAKQKRTSISKLIDNLTENHWLERFIARHQLLYRGGEAVLALRTLALTGSPGEQALALWLLQSISRETQARLAGEAGRLLCTDCIVHCSRHETEATESAHISYYGCRACHQSLNFQVWPGGVVAILDRNSRETKVPEADQIRVNWLSQRSLFDFDRVEIVEASDEEVERFAVLVGNDTDETRRSGYKAMPWVVSPACVLSENTLRVLEYTFGKVEGK